MKASNMSTTITDSLEMSFQNCSLNNDQRRSSVSEGEGIGRSSSSDGYTSNNNSLRDATLELNSHVSLPYHWEQCLDLKTGEIYYINWRNGMKAKEDPRTRAESSRDLCYSEEEEEEEEEDDDDDDGGSSYDSEESSSESSPAASSSKDHINVLVVAGCKSCLMYFMVPKQVEDCPKCNGQLLHFDRSENASP